MEYIGQKPTGYWTKEKCHEIALKFKTKKQFKKEYSYVYKISLKNKYINDITNHMTEIVKPLNYWTKEKCHEESLKYNHRIDFQKNSTSAYIISHNNKWLDDICNHMISLGNKTKRCIYVFEFDDNYAYIGLTYNIEKRINEHLNDKNSSVFNFIKNNNSNYIFKQLTEYKNIEDSILDEETILNNYKENNWNIINKQKTGAVGGNILIWTKEKCQEESLKYKYRKEYEINNPASYKSALRNKWLDDICGHMILKLKPKGYWTKEKCQEESLKHNNKTDFRKYCGGAYYFSFKNNFLNDICQHMIKNKNL